MILKSLIGATAAITAALIMDQGAMAQAAGACLPGVYNPTRPVQPGDCYTPSEFNKAMKGEGQQPIIVGNRDIGIAKKGQYYTSNSNGSKGVNAEMDVAYEEKGLATEIYVGAVYTDIKVNDVNVSSTIPSWAQLDIDNSKAKQYCRRFNGACTSYNDFLRDMANGKEDNRVMMMAQSINSPTANGEWTTGKRLVVFRDMNSGYGRIKDLNSAGALTPAYVMQPVSYTPFASRFMTATHPTSP